MFCAQTYQSSKVHLLSKYRRELEDAPAELQAVVLAASARLGLVAALDGTRLLKGPRSVGWEKRNSYDAERLVR